jgi:TfoX/Sxy family transcriptional regulator of competence genes
MAYDEVLAQRVRDLLSGEVGVTEKRMFSGLAFLEAGALVVAVSHDDLMVRVGRDGLADALARDGVVECVLGGRTMTGWVYVAGEMLDDDELARWVEVARATARSAPPRPARRRAARRAAPSDVG